MSSPFQYQHNPEDPECACEFSRIWTAYPLECTICGKLTPGSKELWQATQKPPEFIDDILAAALQQDYTKEPPKFIWPLQRLDTNREEIEAKEAAEIEKLKATLRSILPEHLHWDDVVDSYRQEHHKQAFDISKTPTAIYNYLIHFVRTNGTLPARAPSMKSKH